MIVNIDQLNKLDFNTKTKVITFDIFDTLIIRKIDPPEEVQRIVCLNAVKRGFFQCEPGHLLKLRNTLESETRKKSKMNCKDPECSIEEIVDKLIIHFSKDISLKKELLELQMEVEMSLIAKMPQIENILSTLSMNYELIAISDTYYPAWFLEEILTSVGLSHYFKRIYSSCDYKLSKRSGKLFNKVVEKEQIEKLSLTHIGDNFLSDYFIPIQLGINSILLYDTWNIKRRNLIRKLKDKEDKSNFWKGYSFINSLKSVHKIKNCRNDSIYFWGKYTIGPLLINFIHMLTLEVKKQQFDNIYFIARDGFILKKIYDKFLVYYNQHNIPSPVYLPISRQISFISSIKSLSEREITLALHGDYIYAKDALSRLGVTDIKKIQHLIDRHNINLDKKYKSDELKSIFTSLIKDPVLEHIILENSKKCYLLLKEFLNQIGFFSDKKRKAAIVDIGWIGTIQSCLEHIFSEDKNCPTITGYYLALIPPDIDEPNLDRKGLILDYRRAFPEEMSISMFREALEISCRPNHGSTVGYTKNKKGKLIPLFSKDHREKPAYSNITKIQQGILDFCDEYLELANILHPDPYIMKSYITKAYENYLTFPTFDEIRELEKIIDSEDFGSNVRKNMIFNYSLKDIFTPIASYQKLIETPWREASIIKSKIPLLLFIFNIVKRIVIWIKIHKYYKI